MKLFQFDKCTYTLYDIMQEYLSEFLKPKNEDGLAGL